MESGKSISPMRKGPVHIDVVGLLSGRGHSLAFFSVWMWIGSFWLEMWVMRYGSSLAAYLDLPPSSSGYGSASFLLGTWTSPFPFGDTNRPLSTSGHGLAPFRLCIWTYPDPVGHMDKRRSHGGYRLVHSGGDMGCSFSGWGDGLRTVNIPNWKEAGV